MFFRSTQYGSFENVDLLKILVKAKAPVNLKNNRNETPRDVARKQMSGVMEKELHRMKAKVKFYY